MSDDEKVFSLGPQFFVDLRRKMATFLTPLFVVILAIGLLVHPLGAHVQGGVLLIVACIAIPLMAFGAWRGYKQQAASFEGFRLYINGDRVRRSQPGLPDLEIARSDVARIVETPGKGLAVFGPGRLNFISVPAGLDGFEEARARLASWREPETRRGGLAVWILMLGILLFLAAIGVVIGSSNRWLVTSLGLGLIGTFLYAFIAGRKSPQLDERTRKSLWFMLFAILLVVARILVVWQP